jgi:hypothetical protein
VTERSRKTECEKECPIQRQGIKEPHAGGETTSFCSVEAPLPPLCCFELKPEEGQLRRRRKVVGAE